MLKSEHDDEEEVGFRKSFVDVVEGKQPVRKKKKKEISMKPKKNAQSPKKIKKIVDVSKKTSSVCVEKDESLEHHEKTLTISSTGKKSQIHAIKDE